MNVAHLLVLMMENVLMASTCIPVSVKLGTLAFSVKVLLIIACHFHVLMVAPVITVLLTSHVCVQLDLLGRHAWKRLITVVLSRVLVKWSAVILGIGLSVGIVLWDSLVMALFAMRFIVHRLVQMESQEITSLVKIS
jgi:hypothetical protein